MYKNCLNRPCTKIAWIDHVQKLPGSTMYTSRLDRPCTKIAWIDHVRKLPGSTMYKNCLDRPCTKQKLPRSIMYKIAWIDLKNNKTTANSKQRPGKTANAKQQPRKTANSKQQPEQRTATRRKQHTANRNQEKAADLVVGSKKIVWRSQATKPTKQLARTQN